MRRHRVFVSRLSREVRLVGGEAEHLRVLRASVGDRVTVFDGSGLEADAVIAGIDEAGVLLVAGEPRAVSVETPAPVTLAVSLLKGDKLVDVVRAGTELGAAAFQLVVARRSDAREIGAAKLERLRRVAVEAAKQSRRAVTPVVLAPVPLAALPAVSCGLVAHPGAARLAPEVVSWAGPVWLATGPEGGFAPEEVRLLEERGFVAVNLGPRVLRAETAPLALLAAVGAAQGV